MKENQQDCQLHCHIYQQVQESQDDLRAILNAADESIILLNIDGTIIDINETAARRCGVGRSAMLGREFCSFQTPEMAALRRADLVRCLESRQTITGEDWYGGQCFAWRLHPIMDSMGGVRRLCVFAKDITGERRFQAIESIFKRLDELLLFHRANLRQIGEILCKEVVEHFSCFPVWMARCDTGNRLSLLCGDGGSYAEIARAALAFPPPTFESDDSNPVFAAVASGLPQVLRHGSQAWAALPEELRKPPSNMLAVLPLYVGNGIFGVLVIHGQVADEPTFLSLFENLATIAHHAGLSLESAADQSQLRLFEKALSFAGSSIFITDINGHIVWVNDAFLRVSGYSREELSGKNPGMFSSGVHNPAFFSQMWATLRQEMIWRGDIVNRRKDGILYTSRQTITPLQNGQGVSHYVSILEDVTEQYSVTRQLEHLASHDPLTDLPNRILLQRTLEKTLALLKRQGTSCAILFVDLDHFKEINDQLGHAAGDRVLIEVAERLNRQVRLSDTVARYAGDEFVIILNDLENPFAAASSVAAKLVASLEGPISFGDQEIVVGCSIGISLAPENSSNAETLIRLADQAMYSAKLAGRNTWRFYSWEESSPGVIE